MPVPAQPLSSRPWALIISSAACLIAVLVFFWLKWKGLDLSVKVADLPGLLAPVAFAAAVIERAVEILVSPWRDAGASKLQRALDSIKARPAYPASNVQNALDQQNASNALDDYRGQTQRYAFAVSLILSTLVSIAGVRVLWPFVNQVKFSDKTATSLAQQIFFLAVDVLVSAALLAGGADGIHSVVNAVTTFFESTADRTSKPTS